MHTVVKKSLSLFFALTLLFSPLAAPLLAPKAEAQMGGAIASCLGGYVAGLIGSFLSFLEVPVSDTKNTIKECVDAIAFALAKTLLAQLTDSIINWINTGFDGNPFYIGDTGSFFTNVIRDELQLALNDLKQTGTIFIDTIVNEAIYRQRLTLHKQFTFSLDTDIIRGLCGYAEYQAQEFCTSQLTPESRFELTQAFTRGYIPFQWSTWESLTQNCGNNAFCASTAALNYQLAQRREQVQQVNDDLNRGSGFLSQKVCKDPGFQRDLEDWYDEVNSYTAPNPGGDNFVGPPEPPSGQLRDRPVCREYIIQTPGRIIADKLTSNLGTSERQLELADELNESIAAIFNALIEKLISTGLKSFDGGNSDDNDSYYSSLNSGNSGFEYDLTNSSLEQDPEACEFAGGVYDEELAVCDFDAATTSPTGPPQFPFTLTDGRIIQGDQDLAALINANPGVCIQIDEIRIVEGSEPCLIGVSSTGGGGETNSPTLTITPDPLVVGSLATFTISNTSPDTEFEVLYAPTNATNSEFLISGITEANGTGTVSIQIPDISTSQVLITVGIEGETIEQVVGVSR